MLFAALFVALLSFAGGKPKLIVGGQVTGSSMGSSTVELFASFVELAVEEFVEAETPVELVASLVLAEAAELVLAVAFDGVPAVADELRDGGCGRNAAGIIAGVIKLLELT